jgi:hypothetical protein
MRPNQYSSEKRRKELDKKKKKEEKKLRHAEMKNKPEGEGAEGEEGVNDEKTQGDTESGSPSVANGEKQD